MACLALSCRTQMLEEIAAAKTEECEKLQQSVKLLQV
jgi:hypothetical protein